MIPIGDVALYRRSLQALSDFVGRGYRGRLVQIFLVAKFHGLGFPRVGQQSGIDVGDLQHLLDTFYWKPTAGGPNRHVAIIFGNSHLVPTGTQAGGLDGPSNIWRNNLGLQKAQICFATEAELSDPGFLEAPRIACPHLRPTVAGSLERARCGLNDGPSYRGEEGPKALRRDPLDGSYSIVPPENTEFWAAVVRSRGRPLPVVPLIMALYHDSDVAGGRQHIDVVDFVRDFGFSREEFGAYFQDDPQDAVHANLLDDLPGLTWTRLQVAPPPRLLPNGAVVPTIRARRQRERQPRQPVDLDALPDAAPRMQPPAGSNWWSAEQAVMAYLRASGWDVKDRSRQPVGFDLEARRGNGIPMYIEVKSSVGACTPVLTKNEYEAAVRHGDRYVLAILERFDPHGPVAVLWVRNPATLGIVARQVTQFPIPRSIWLTGASTDLG